MSESAADFQQREAWLQAWNEPRAEWRCRGAGEIAFALEGLGVSPDGFERLLHLVDELSCGYVPAGLTDLAPGFRFAVFPVSKSAGLGGNPLGTYRDAVILARTVSIR